MSTERKRVTKSSIEALREEGFGAEQISTKLGMSLNDYKDVLKFFGIKGKHKVGVKARFQLVDDTKSDEKTEELNVQEITA
tara:strand:- start:28777 stop:29019 length:243 start_codon:yes stop_codon:yes gene_type:complete